MILRPLLDSVYRMYIKILYLIENNFEKAQLFISNLLKKMCNFKVFQHLLFFIQDDADFACLFFFCGPLCCPDFIELCIILIM
jgi:hypothetical protein